MKVKIFFRNAQASGLGCWYPIKR